MCERKNEMKEGTEMEKKRERMKHEHELLLD
jgi:hypothetical protein